MQRYEVIFFDLDHTLVDTRGQYDLGLARALRAMYAHEVPSDFQRLFMAHHQRLWPAYDKRTLTMTELRRQRFLLAWRDLGQEKSIAEADAFHEAYMAAFDDTLVAYEGTLEMIHALAADHRLGIITNGSPDLQERKLQVTGLKPYFTSESIIVSEHIGMAKPHPSVYAAAFRALNVHPSKALMVGDNYEADVRGATACGMDAIWYVPDAEMKREISSNGLQRAVETPQALRSAIEKLEQARKV